MSNILNVFGNEGWVQSSIDHSRGKTRGKERAKNRAAGDAARRKQLLEEDPLFIKNTQAAKPPAGTGILSILRARILKQKGILQS